jgi:hypothetical protein
MFTAAWALLRRLVSSEVEEKIVFMKKTEDLFTFEYFTPEQVPEALGGTMNPQTKLEEFIRARCEAEGIDANWPYLSLKEATKVFA